MLRDSTRTMLTESLKCVNSSRKMRKYLYEYSHLFLLWSMVSKSKLPDPVSAVASLLSGWFCLKHS